MVSLPGDSASSERVVKTPYATASNAQTTATSAPWSDRKLDKRSPLDSDKAETTARETTGRRGARGYYRGGLSERGVTVLESTAALTTARVRDRPGSAPRRASRPLRVCRRRAAR